MQRRPEIGELLGRFRQWARSTADAGGQLPVTPMREHEITDPLLEVVAAITTAAASRQLQGCSNGATPRLQNTEAHPPLSEILLTGSERVGNVEHFPREHGVRLPERLA
jgi:hypothetical protein